MAGLRYYDRVQETTTTTGTGTLTLAGAASGFQAFSAVLATGERVYYVIVDSSNAWEVGLGTYTLSGTTLSRDRVLASSNSNALISVASGTSKVWLDYPAAALADRAMLVAVANNLLAQ